MCCIFEDNCHFSLTFKFLLWASQSFSCCVVSQRSFSSEILRRSVSPYDSPWIYTRENMKIGIMSCISSAKYFPWHWAKTISIRFTLLFWIAFCNPIKCPWPFHNVCGVHSNSSSVKLPSSPPWQQITINALQFLDLSKTFSSCEFKFFISYPRYCP